MAEALLDDEVVRVRGSVLTNEGGGALEAADSAGGENSERCFDCKMQGISSTKIQELPASQHNRTKTSFITTC